MSPNFSVKAHEEGATNTIDDSQWSTPALMLSRGWNMLRLNGSDQYVNASQVDGMVPLLSQFWNSSISWTTTLGSSTTLTFNGESLARS